MYVNWYKQAADGSPLQDRNIINNKIIVLNDIFNTLDKMSQVVLQDKIVVKNMNDKIINNKTLSSYPAIVDILVNANNIVYDNPWKFSALCKIANEKIGRLIVGLKKEREELTSDNIDRLKQKGWWI